MLVIKKAEKVHIQEIVDISKTLLRDNEENSQKNKGFLIRELKEEVVEAQINEFYVALIEEKVAGYLWTNDYYPITRKENSIFNKEVDLSKSIYVKQVATSNSFGRKGIASKLYEYIISENKSKNIIACVAIKPIINEPSIMFHEKLGFEQIGELKLDDYLGFDHYLATIFYRENK